MKIGIVLHPYVEAKPGGLARTILEWTRGLLAVDQTNEYIIFVKGNPVQPDFAGKNWRMVSLGSGRFWLDRLSRETRCDLYLFQTPVLPLRFRVPNAVIIAQDFPYLRLKPRTLRDFVRRPILRWYHARSLKRARAVIAVSHSTKQDLAALFHVPESKITVIPMGFKDVCKTSEAQVELPKKFFLFVGVLKERKNVLNVVRAFAEFKKANSALPHQLVFGGKDEGAYAARVRALAARLGTAGDVQFLGYLNDRQLSYAYRRAEALLFPSIVESFGFPVLEAMACGTPVITSNIEGPSEIGKNAALLVNPYSPRAIAAGMERIARDGAFRSRLVAAGLRRAQDFSWEKTARETLALFQKLVP